jgi:hypothetical protein
MLPIETKRAMLVGLENEAIVTGAYSHDGGICPMLAAHRRGGRTSQESFARAWDRYTGARTGRRATERELRTLRTMLEASVLEPVSLSQAAAEIRAARPKRDTGERNRTGELRKRDGWAWSRLFRRWDTYSAAVAALEDGVAADGLREESPVLVPDLLTPSMATQSCGNSRLTTLPVALRGSSSRNVTSRGTL